MSGSLVTFIAQLKHFQPVIYKVDLGLITLLSRKIYFVVITFDLVLIQLVIHCGSLTFTFVISPYSGCTLNVLYVEGKT